MSKKKQEYRLKFIYPDGKIEHSNWCDDPRLGYFYHLGWKRALENSDVIGREFEIEQRDSVPIDSKEA